MTTITRALSTIERLLKERDGLLRDNANLRERVSEMAVAARSWTAFKYLVHNTADDEPEPVGGADVSACYNDDKAIFEVGADFGETGLCASGPTLELAVVAASMLDEAEHGAVDSEGRWICEWCGAIIGGDADGCEECPSYPKRLPIDLVGGAS